MKTKQLICIILSVCLYNVTHAQSQAAYQAKTFVHQGDTLPYRILYPDQYQADQKYPVLIFLHGAGERGNDNRKQLKHGGDLFLRDTVRLSYPSIVIFPQCPADSYWSNVATRINEAGKREFFFKKGGKPTKAMALLQKLTKQVLKEAHTDPDRMYIGGLSMGAMGTFEALRRNRNLFAAAFAICGADHPANVRKYSQVPLWIFHGEKDDIVLPENSIRIVNELQKHGANPRFNLYPNSNHNSWDPAFAEPEFLRWLFSHQKKR